MTLEEMVQHTPVGESRVFNPGQSGGDPQPRFFEIRSNYRCKNELFEWINRCETNELPKPATVNHPARWVSNIPEYSLQFHGNKAELGDYYEPGLFYFISERLCDLLQEFDPEGVDAAPATLRMEGRTERFKAFMPKRALVAADLSRTEIKVTRGGADRQGRARVSLPAKFHFNPAIGDGVHLFNDLARHKMYWSRELLSACRAAGIHGITAVASYAQYPEVIGLQGDQTLSPGA